MKISWRTLLATATVFCSLPTNLAAEAAHAGGAPLPPAIKVGDRQLSLNGWGIGTELIVKVYVIGLYLQSKTTDPQASIVTDEGKGIVMTMLRDVSRERFVQAVEKGMSRNAGPAMPTLRARLDTLENALPSLRKGDLIQFAYLPGVGTLVSGQGRRLTIPGKDFADALLSVWLGPKAANTALRSHLLQK